MESKVRVVNREDLVSKGIKVITDTEEVISIDGIEINQDIKKCFLTILEADAEHKRIEHTKKIEEGMRSKGAKRGRLPLSEDIQHYILELRRQGLTYEEIRKKLESGNIKVSVKTINKYCKKGVKSNDSE